MPIPDFRKAGNGTEPLWNQAGRREAICSPAPRQTGPFQSPHPGEVLTFFCFNLFLSPPLSLSVSVSLSLCNIAF